MLIENGHVTHFTFAVTDQNKDQSSTCCSTGSKVVVVPFDGVAFDREKSAAMARTPALVVVAAAEAAEDRMGAPVALAAVQAAAAWMRVLGR